jgi:hypothetical protein
MAGVPVRRTDSRPPGAQQYRRDVNVNLVEESCVRTLLDGVNAVDPNGRLVVCTMAGPHA